MGNKLTNSSSPYLRQHANNPVNWYPWGDEALELAKKEDKPIIVSIGYSSCHWCHVMERESFENDSIAEIMNAHFINIKVDREERPDIDQIYMDAVQAMGINGGWPLNVFLTPDQKPFYGGTYFPPRNWATLLTNIHKAFTEERAEIESSANKLTDAIGTSEMLRFKLKPSAPDYTLAQQDQMFQVLAPKFDSLRGGFDRAPKFPMPVIWHWMLTYALESMNDEALRQVHTTLRAMAMGGIFDQIGGGFARYSTDKEWLVPHFEKMLYDNGQLLRLDSLAYKNTPDPLYMEMVERTADWLEQEMTDDKGGFYAALDADSEGIEGKYYVWKFNEFRSIAENDASMFGAYLDVSAEGNWEGVSILRRMQSDRSFAERNGLKIEEFTSKKEALFTKLLRERSTRVRPGLDDKIITGWNGIAITGLAEAYQTFGEQRYLDMALRAAEFAKSDLITGDRLLRTAKGEIAGYLEDYAFLIEAFIKLYEVTFDEQWLNHAESLTNYTLNSFLDTAEDMFYFTDGNYHDLVIRKKELFDNVIPASNSQMALNLHRLGIILDRAVYTELSATMLSRMKPLLMEAVNDMSNWARLHLNMLAPMAEIVIIGPEAQKFRAGLASENIGNGILMGTEESSDLPLLQHKSTIDGRTTIYVCYNKTCKLPVTTVEDALKQLR